MYPYLYDVSEIEFEELCEEMAFYLFERAVAKESTYSNKYDELWDKFFQTKPYKHIKYDYITKLGTRVRFTPDESNRYPLFRYKDDWAWAVNTVNI